MYAKPSKILVVLLAFTLAVPAFADRTALKPGWNLFSPEQDIEMGRQVSREAEAQLPIMNDRQATAYLNALGRQLASRAPNSQQYPFQFKIVNDKSINAFALPGGYVYVNRGTFEAAANEAQLAGVIAHEIGHVVLRHGTNQASKAYAAQAPLALLGGVLGSNSVGSVIAQLSLGFGVNSLLMKYSRDAERQADLMGTQILYDTGYDPRQMAQFFERLQAESKGGGRATEFFSDHPNPENRIGNVNNEVTKLGGARGGARLDSPDFQEVKRILASAPESRSGRPTSNGRSPSRSSRPQRPSNRLVEFRSGDFQLRHPDNWQAYGQGSAVTLAPEGGIASGSLAYGVIIAPFEPHDDNGDRRITLGEATDQLIQSLQQSNPQMRSARNHQRIRVDNQSALWTELSNESPVGGRENDILVTVAAPDGQMYYFIAVAPQSDFPDYSAAFEDILSTVRFR